jgi:hypothetical protein
MNRDKDFVRKMKRFLKREGNKKKRQWLKRQLELSPEDAPNDEYDFGDLSTKELNGNDFDSTRLNPFKKKYQQDTNSNWHGGIE